jgi:hypothetical protein
MQFFVGDMFSSTAIKIIDKAKVFRHLEARLRAGRGIPHSKDSLSLSMVQYSKDTCSKKKVSYNASDDL